MRGYPSLLLLYLGLTTCSDTSPGGEQDQGECLWDELVSRHRHHPPIHLPWTQEPLPLVLFFPRTPQFSVPLGPGSSMSPVLGTLYFSVLRVL